MFKKFFATHLVLAALAALGAAQQPAPLVAYGLTDENDLVRFNISNGRDASPILGGGAILGLGGQDLLGIDFRPADKGLYGLGNFGDVFRIDVKTRRATVVSTVGVPLEGSRFGIDFDPVTDRLRIVSESRQNLSVNVDTGATVVNQELYYADPYRTPAITGLAFANNVRGATSTTLFGLGSNGGLFTLDTGGSGLVTYVGGTDETTGSLSGFDIAGDYAFALTSNANGAYSPGFFLYSCNIGAGERYLYRSGFESLGGGDNFDGLAIAPVPEPATMAAMALGLTFFARRRRR